MENHRLVFFAALLAGGCGIGDMFGSPTPPEKPTTDLTDGEECSRSDQCRSYWCSSDSWRCAAPTCTDKAQNGTETDTDCGGMCPACGYGRRCWEDSHCQSGKCGGGACAAAPSCADKAKNGVETDVDCGGELCPPCAVGKGCVQEADCTSLVCASGKCAAPAYCANGQSDVIPGAYGTETDVDCGGELCPPCGVGKKCAAARDCTTALCFNGRCIQPDPTCADKAQNGTETDVDCGGMCPACGDGLACLVGTDCTSLVCADSKCAAPTCADKAKNGAETDTDCGGGMCPACGDNDRCLKGTDCKSLNCKPRQGGYNSCEPSSCSDGIRNGAETDVDCGGRCEKKCGPGQGCNNPLTGKDSDVHCAAPLVCRAGRCVAP